MVGYWSLNLGVYKKNIINKAFVDTVSKRDWQWSCYVTITCDKIITIILLVHRRRQSTDVGRWNVTNAYRFDTPFLNTWIHLLQEKCIKRTCTITVYMFSHDTLQSLFAKLVQTAIMHQLVMFTQKIHFTNRTSQFLMIWNRPCYSYQLQIFRGYAQFSFKKSR